MFKQILFTLLSLSSAMIAEEIDDLSNKEPSPHRISYGLDIFHFDIDTTFSPISVKQSSMFWGVSLKYEYLKAKSIYANVNSAASFGCDDFDLPIGSYYVTISRPVMRRLSYAIGYTFAPSKWFISPFFTSGIFILNAKGRTSGFKETLPYLGLGLRTQYFFSEISSITLNVKGLRTISGEQMLGVNNIFYVTQEDMWGVEVTLPITFKFGTQRRWDIQIEPYYLGFDFSGKQNIFGGRLLFGGSF